MKGVCEGDTLTSKSLNGHEAKDIEEELYTTLRNQVSRNSPVKLPRPSFWKNLKLLCEYVEAEVNSLGQKEGWSPRSQAAARRLANIRRAIAELSQHRLTAFLRHASASQLKIINSGTSTEAIDWGKHDPAERVFHQSLMSSIESFKNNVDWDNIQKGIGEALTSNKVPKGTQQLDEFVEDDEEFIEGGTPVLNFAEEEPEEILVDELDEEERIARMETYPESNDLQLTTTESSDTVEMKSSETEDIMRIRIIKDEGVMMDDKGDDFEVNSGDIHQLSEPFARLLIESGIAEEANI